MSSNDMKDKKKVIEVRDLRSGKANSDKELYRFDISNIKTFQDIYLKIKQLIHTEFVLCTPNRTPITNDNFEELRSNDVLYIFEDINQPLPKAVQMVVNIAPHPDTITKSGMYEYYSSRGIDSVVISIAELIDNSLAATKDNDKNNERLIEIRYYDDAKDSLMCIIDNGHGMDNYQLTNWAKFKYSKFVRDYRFDSNRMPPPTCTSATSASDSGFESFCSSDLPLRPHRTSTPMTSTSTDDYCPRYLDSEINYFGAGGKQAIFNIGEMTTMNTKKRENNDINELTLSKEEFDSKAHSNPDDVYKCILSTRTIGTDRQLPDFPTNSAYIENEVIKEMEQKYESFTCCCIKNIINKNNTHLRKGTDSSADWIKNLSRIYHYYIHGPNGNSSPNGQHLDALPPELRNLKILVKVFNVSKTDGIINAEERSVINLREIYDDYETQLVRTASASFEFDIECPNKDNIEGVVRYHPYLHDHETLPKLTSDDELCETNSYISRRTDVSELNAEDVEDYRRSEPFRHKDREVFECYWHGRLIPADNIDFEWNKFNSSKSVNKSYEECFNRLSGALFTNHSYEVSQNKQSFIDLGKSMAQKSLSFYRVSVEENGERRRLRGNFATDFVNWIKDCHTKYDKQVKYLNHKGHIERTYSDFPKSLKRVRGETFTVFHEIHWRDKKWKVGDKVKTTGTKPTNLIGSIVRFLVPVKIESYTTYEGSPGFIEISQLPEEIYGKDNDAKKICLFTQISHEVSKQQIDKELVLSYEKLPHKILITFPRQNAIRDGEQIIAGRAIGDIQAYIQNLKGVNLKDKIPFKAGFKELRLQLEILRKEADGTTTEVEYPIAKWTKQWDYWFTGTSNDPDDPNVSIKRTGEYCLMAVVLLIKGTEALSKFPNGKSLPSAKKINFKVIAGPAIRFMICEEAVKTRVGDEFDLTLKFFDKFENETNYVFSEDNLPLLTLNGFEANYKILEEDHNKYIIKNITIVGNLNNSQQVETGLILKVELPAIEKFQEVHVLLKEGNPHSIRVYPNEQLEFINGNTPDLRALVFDVGGNDITFLNKWQISCNFFEIRKNGTKAKVSAEYYLTKGMHGEQDFMILKRTVTIIAPDQSSQNSRRIIAKFSLKNTDIYLERNIIVKKSCKPSVIKLFRTTNVNGEQELKEIPNDIRLELFAGSTLSGVLFKVYDCDGSELPLPQLDVSNLEITWALDRDYQISDGLLPDIVWPTSTRDVRKNSIIWKQIDKNINLRHDFYSKAIPKSAVRIEVDASSRSMVFPIGEVVDNVIYLTVFDEHNNIIRCNDLLNELIVRPVSQSLKIDEMSLKKALTPNPNEGSFTITGIKLDPNENMNSSEDPMVGKNKLLFKIERISTYSDITVVNGIPKCLKWLNISKFGLTVVQNNQRLQLQTRLLDAYNNPVVDSQLTAKLRLGPEFLNCELTSNIDSQGIATFCDIIKINKNEKMPSKCSPPNEIQRDMQSCRKCYGFTKVFAQVLYNQQSIQTTHHWLHILCDDKTPAKFDITHKGSCKVIAKKDEMPTIDVVVRAEEDSIIRNLDVENISMRLSTGNGVDYVEFSPKKTTKGIFHFKPDLSPFPGEYRVKIVYNHNDSQPIESNFYREVIKVVPGPPRKLSLKSGPLNDPIIVSNTANNRTIINNRNPLSLELVDSNDVAIYNNISPQELESNPIYCGHLSVTIVNSNNEQELPELEGCDSNKRLKFDIKGGKAVVKELRLKTNTRGKDSEIYIIEFDAKLVNNSIKVEAFELKMLFCDDSNKQSELNELQMDIKKNKRKREEIVEELTNYRIDRESQQNCYNSCLKKEQLLRDKLNQLGEDSDLSCEQNIISKIDEYNCHKNELKLNEMNRVVRGIDLPIAPKRNGVIGRIAHLAYIEEEETALVISWFLRNHMNSIVTNTSEEAEKIMDERIVEMNATFPLDQIEERDLPKQWYDRLPHDSKFDVSSDVGYARNRLEFLDKYEKESQKVFGSLLNNTLIMESKKDAKTYRNKLRKFCKCPTILTKCGHMLYENGIIDGSANLEDFTSAAFQTPPNKELLKVMNKIDLLQKLLKAIKITAQELKSFKNLEKTYESLRQKHSKVLEEVDHNLSQKESQFKRLSFSGQKANRTPFEARPDVNTIRRSLSGSYDSEPNAKRPRIKR